jgi:uncharacterized protein
MPTLTLEQVRLVHLAAQGLLTAPEKPACKADVLTAIRRMGVLQIDTISVVARSPYFVLFSRLGEYDSKWLDELLVEKALFEQWARAACFIPMEDFPLFRRLTLEGHRVSYFGEWAEQNRSTLDHVLEVVRQQGAKRSADFESVKSPGGWWNWKIEKAALEYWFARGELMVARRDRFQRVYDLQQRVLPDWNDVDAPPLKEVQQELVLKTVRRIGVARRDWIWNYYGIKKKLALQLIDELLAEGKVQRVEVEDWPEPAVYHPEDEPLVRQAAAGALSASHTTLLSPFDPVTWDRERAQQMFGFEFKIQAYTPAAKRQFGYFPLPILHHGGLVGRLDAKAHRKEGVFEVKSVFLENGLPLSEGLVHDLAVAIKRCAQWHKTPAVVVRECFPTEFLRLLTNSLGNINLF